MSTTDHEADEQDSPPTIEGLAERIDFLEHNIDIDEAGIVGTLWRRLRKFEDKIGHSEFEEPEEGSILARLDRVEGRLDELEQRLGRIETVADPDALDYEQMDRGEKVRKLRQHLVKRAQSTQRGAAALDYREVTAFFDGNPAPGTAYSLMEAAGDKDGFTYREFRRDDRNKRVSVDLDRLNDQDLLSGGEEKMEGVNTLDRTSFRPPVPPPLI